VIFARTERETLFLHAIIDYVHSGLWINIRVNILLIKWQANSSRALRLRDKYFHPVYSQEKLKVIVY
jgi:hypothetical protein